jgi:hypothetical protein
MPAPMVEAGFAFKREARTRMSVSYGRRVQLKIAGLLHSLLREIQEWMALITLRPMGQLDRTDGGEKL